MDTNKVTPEDEKIVCEKIADLVSYGLKSGLVDPADTVYTVNRLLEDLELSDFTADMDSISVEKNVPKLADILNDIMDYAVKAGLFEDSIASRDLFDTKLMGALTPLPSTVRSTFAGLYKKSPKEATDYYYSFSKATNYIRTDRIAKDEKWTTDTEFGTIDITINLSKPEKDPRDIAKAGKAKASGYPKCLLCCENEGYAGHLSHPARQNHRIIPFRLAGQDYFLQYSPYVYYNEHCIIFNKLHTPMKIDKAAFEKLLDFVNLFPHYTAGSNADLPIVGGSILSHDHFQGGGYEFAMVRAPYEKEFEFNGFEDVHAGLIHWPLTTIRLQGKDKARVAELGDKILTTWRGYTDEASIIFAETDNTPHNTITPIARIRRADGSAQGAGVMTEGDLYELDLVLRNNLTTEENPLGLYHPHAQYHHIKKENIGLIEVMGLAVLPARLKKEMAALEELILADIAAGKSASEIGANIKADEVLASHADWAEEFIERRGTSSINKDNIHTIVQDEIGQVFSHVLEDAGVYKCTKEGRTAFMRFVDAVNA